jgi:Domain of unknown function (DUF4349)
VLDIRQRRMAYWSLALVLVLTETGCGSMGGAIPPAAVATVSPEPVTVAAPPPPPPAPVDASSALPASAPAAPGTSGAKTLSTPEEKPMSGAPHSAAMLIYTANLSMAVYQVNQGMDAVEQIGREMGGYLSTRSDNAVTIRVQRDRFRDALARIEKLGDVLHRDIKAEDVTDEFVDLEARIKNAHAMRDRLTELLQKAQVKEAIEIQKELGKVTEEIERMEGRMKLLKDQIAFSTIGVSFSPVADQTVHDTTLLAPFPWLEKLGLSSLLSVHQ